MSHLKKALYDAYEGFSDKRIKNLEKGSAFVVDDRNPGSFDARGRLFFSFCAIFVHVVSETEVVVRLTGGVPTSPSLKAWVKTNGGKLSPKPQKELTFSIKQGNESNLLSLATEIEEIVAPGKRYSERAYKYVCPQTANSLRRLAKVLHVAWPT